MAEVDYTKPRRGGHVVRMPMFPKFTVGDYTLIYSGDRYWIRNKEGGGSEVDRVSVERMFKKLFEGDF